MSIVPKYSILCFGDSNTWGFVPGSGARYQADVRWPGILRQALGSEWWVIEEGLNGRTTIWDDPAGVGRNGKTYLPPCLQSHRPIDAVILALGLNDLKPKFGASAESIAAGAATLIALIRESGAGAGGGSPRILVVAPPRIGHLSGYRDQFDGAQADSARLAGCLADVAHRTDCEFLDTTAEIAASDIDGIHLDAGGHRALGLAVAGRVRGMFD